MPYTNAPKGREPRKPAAIGVPIVRSRVHVFLDTSTLEAVEFDLDWPILQRVMDSPQVVIHTTKLTLFEIQARIESNVTKAQKQVREAEKWLKAKPQVSSEWKDASRFVGKYRSRCAYQHEGEDVSMSKLANMFMGRDPPFSKQKPDEFKDAIAALSLHQWAEREQQIVYVVSEDRDWKDVCERFQWFEMATLGQLGQILANRDRGNDDDGVADFDIFKIQQSIESSELALIDALNERTPSINGTYSVIFEECVEVSRCSIQIEKSRVDGIGLLVEASLSAVAELDLIDRKGRHKIIEGAIAATLEARLGGEYQTLRIEIVTWEILSLAMPSSARGRTSGDES